VQEIHSLPAGLPRWVAVRPHLACRLLTWRNAYRQSPRRTALSAALIAGAIGVVAIVPPTGPILTWLGTNWAVTFVIATSGFALSTARRRQRAAMEAATSWLASLPVPGPARGRVVIGTAARLAIIVTLTALMWLFGAIGRFAFSRLAFAVAAGAIVGLLAGWRLPRAGIGAPGFHYAIVRRTRPRWASAPSLVPLANWPAAQGRIFSRPKRTAPLVLIAMMGIPAGLHGAPGQVALAVAGACMALFGLLSLSAAAVQVAPEAARWLAPTILDRWRFVASLIWRVALTQAMMLAVLILLAAAVEGARALAVGVPLAAAYLAASLALAVVAAFQASRRVGLGAPARAP
jgi:hypothetical protein